MVFSSIGKYRHQSDYGHPYPSPTKGLTVSLLKGGMGDFWKKNILQTDLEDKKFLQGNTWGKDTEKKYISWLIILKKNRTLLFVGEEDSITRGFEKKNFFFLPKPNHPYLHPLKSQMVSP